MLDIFLTIAPLFLVIFGSALFAKLRPVKPSITRVLNGFALYVGLPALIFSALVQHSFSFIEELDIIVANSFFIIGGFILAALIGKLFGMRKNRFRTLFICMTFGNIAYLGIPVILQLRGQAALAQTSLIIAIYLFWMFTIGIGYLSYSQASRKRDILKNIVHKLSTNTPLLAVVLGIAISSLGITIPEVLLKPVDMIAASVTPVVLVVIGLFIGKSHIGNFREWIPVFLFTFTTLIILPAAFYVSILIFGLSLETYSLSIIEAAMPLAITTFALADEFHLNKVFISRAIVLSTTLSALTIPFWTALL